MLHSASISPDANKQVIAMPAGTPRTVALRLIARGGSVSIQRIIVQYGNGQTHYETRPGNRPISLGDGERTRDIDNRMANDFLDDVRNREVESRVVEGVTLEIAANSRPTPGARIEIWGLRAPPSFRPVTVSSMRPRGEADGAAPPPRPTIGLPAPGPPMAQATKPAASKRYTEVPVLYGTTRAKAGEREKNDRKITSYSAEQGDKLALGLSVVTVPLERPVGSIPRPRTIPIIRYAFRNEDPNRDFTLAAVEELSEADFKRHLGDQAGVSKRYQGQAFVFVHGYNVSFEDAIFRTAQIVADIGFDGPAVTFSWPSAGGLLNYDHDRETSKASRPGLRQLLEIIARDAGVTAVNIVAHSMGTDPVMEVLKEQGEIVSRSGQTVDFKLNEVVLAAPDISRRVFEQFAASFARLARGGVTLYASRNDLALKASKKKASGLVRAGDVPREGIVIVPGVESIDISNASTSVLSLNHSNFADRQHIITDMQLLFERTTNDAKRPPSKRLSVYRQQGTQQKVWWQYVKN